MASTPQPRASTLVGTFFVGPSPTPKSVCVLTGAWSLWHGYTNTKLQGILRRPALAGVGAWPAGAGLRPRGAVLPQQGRHPRGPRPPPPLRRGGGAVAAGAGAVPLQPAPRRRGAHVRPRGLGLVQLLVGPPGVRPEGGAAGDGVHVAALLRGLAGAGGAVQGLARQPVDGRHHPPGRHGAGVRPASARDGLEGLTAGGGGGGYAPLPRTPPPSPDAEFIVEKT